MSPSFAFLVGLWVGSAFVPGALERQLAEERGELRLPLDFARAEARQLTLVFHQRRDVPPATYEPAAGNLPPRLAVYTPHYLRGGALRPLLDLSVDLCQTYLQAILESHLRRQLASGGGVGEELRRRALATMTDVPPPYRVDAYLDAQASFGAHLLALANEIDRNELRRRAAGRSLCPLLERPEGPLPLMQLWERTFGDEGFPGAYVERGTHGEARVRFSRSTLSRDDKRFLVARVLGAGWTGSPAADLRPRYCPPGGEGRRQP